MLEKKKVALIYLFAIFPPLSAFFFFLIICFNPTPCILIKTVDILIFCGTHSFTSGILTLLTYSIYTNISGKIRGKININEKMLHFYHNFYTKAKCYQHSITRNYCGKTNCKKKKKLLVFLFVFESPKHWQTGLKQKHEMQAKLTTKIPHFQTPAGDQRRNVYNIM